MAGAKAWRARGVGNALLLLSTLLILSCPIYRPAGPELEPFRPLDEMPAKLSSDAYLRPPSLYGVITSGDNLISHPALCDWGGVVLVEDLLGSPQLRLFSLTTPPEDLGAFTPQSGYQWLETACLGNRLAIYQGRGMHLSLTLIDNQGNLLGNWSLSATKAPSVRQDWLFINSGKELEIHSLTSGTMVELGAPGLGAIPLGWGVSQSGDQQPLYYLLGSSLYRLPADLSRSFFVRKLEITRSPVDVAILPEPDRLYQVIGGSLPLITAWQIGRGRSLWTKSLTRSFTRYRLFAWEDQVLVLGYTPAREGVSGARLEGYSVLAGDRGINFKFSSQGIPLAIIPLEDPPRLVAVEVMGFAEGEGWPGHDLPGLPQGPRPSLERLHTVITCLDEGGSKLYQLMPTHADLILPLNRRLLIGINLGSEVRDASLVGFSTEDGQKLWQLELGSVVVEDFFLRDPYVALVLRDEEGNFSLSIYRFASVAPKGRGQEEGVE